MARILLVEDEMLVRELAFEDLSDAGFDVIAAGDGDEGLGILQQDRRFDLLFTDVKMPGSTDGWQLAAEAKRLISGLKVIFATGLEPAPDYIGPGDRYLQKPYRWEVLLGLLEELGVEA